MNAVELDIVGVSDDGRGRVVTGWKECETVEEVGLGNVDHF